MRVEGKPAESAITLLLQAHLPQNRPQLLFLALLRLFLAGLESAQQFGQFCTGVSSRLQ